MGTHKHVARCTKALLRDSTGISSYQSVLFLLRHVCGTLAAPQAMLALSEAASRLRLAGPNPPSAADCRPCSLSPGITRASLWSDDAFGVSLAGGCHKHRQQDIEGGVQAVLRPRRQWVFAPE
jgi:hypothetical protein